MLRAKIKRRFRRGFLLPTVIIVSVAIMILSVATLTIVTRSSTNQNNQYYQSLARQAAEAGIKMAQTCYDKPEWTSPLVTGYSCDGVSGGLEYVSSGDNWRSVYTVSLPVTSGGKTTIIVTGSVSLFRSNGIAIGVPIEQSLKINVTSVGSANVVTTLAGDVASAPMHSSSLPTYGESTTYALTEDGKIYAWGSGAAGTLGNGTSTLVSNTPVPVDMTAFGSERAVALTTLAGTVSRSGDSLNTTDGRSTIYALSDAGKIYAWGSGAAGTLGNGTSTLVSNTPVPVDVSMMGGLSTPSGFRFDIF